jgi:NAD-dependent DNA ligase
MSDLSASSNKSKSTDNTKTKKHAKTKTNKTIKKNSKDSKSLKTKKCKKKIELIIELSLPQSQPSMSSDEFMIIPKKPIKSKTIKMTIDGKMKTSKTKQKVQLEFEDGSSLKTTPEYKPISMKEQEQELKEEQEMQEIQEPMLAESEIKSLDKQKVYNAEFIDILGEFKDLLQGQGETFRARAYQTAQESIMSYERDITNPDQLKGLKGIGSTILSKLHEYVNTGTIKALEKERKNPINVLTKVYGIGPKKAIELIEKGITTIEELEKNKDLLNDVQKIGLSYYEDINKKIPRDEIDIYKMKFKEYMDILSIAGSRFEIVGSYRRGKMESGDIDVIITNNNNDTSVFNKFITQLKTSGIIKEFLSKGKTKSLTITQLPGSPARRVDFLYSPPNEYSFAILYFTGSKAFNTVMRQRALNKGYTLNEHGISTMTEGVKGGLVDKTFIDEKSIFDFLDMQYKMPNERIDGRAVQNKLEKSVEISVEQSIVEQVQETKKEESKVESGESIELNIKPKSNLKKTSKNVTLKHRKIDPLNDFKANGLTTLKLLSEEELSSMIKFANENYYCNKTPVMTDNQYDILREYTLEIHPNNIIAKEGHVGCKMDVDEEEGDGFGEKSKVTLPYQMWSMDKIKPDTGALEKWLKTYKGGSYVISCKLDGVSGLYTTEGPKPKLYTRGNGVVGQDVSHLIPYLKLPKTKNITIRGEFIIAKDTFNKKFSNDFSNPRNFIAGLVNQKQIHKDRLQSMSFVAYEVIRPELKPSEQMQYLETLDVEVVRYVELNELSNEKLSELLVQWRENYKYEIDGVICIDNNIYPRTGGNPEYAFAFKMVLSDQVAEAKVVDVIWTPSKDGLLKPRVQIEPVVLSGAKIEYATGFNAKFIEDNKIGVGAVIQLVRSGDVIPHILSVPQPADKPLMPNENYIWNETHVDIMLVDKEQNVIVREKNIETFFNKIGVEGFKMGKIKKVVAAGYDTIPKILKMTAQDFVVIDGFAKKSAEQISQNIKEKVDAVSLVVLMSATNFARGMGEKKIGPILEKYPDILTSPLSDNQKIELIMSVKGNARNSATKFVENIPEFISFIKETNLENKLIGKAGDKTSEINEEILSHPLYGKRILMTGFRDKELINAIKSVGGEMADGVSKTTFVVLVKNVDETTGKADKARELGIDIMTPGDFKLKYGL